MEQTTAFAADIVLAYITAGSREEALNLGRALVEAGLAACVNVIDGMTSIYRWQGTIETATEAILIAKTTRAAFPKLAARVRELHSYETPCILEIPIERGGANYLAWLQSGVSTT